MKQGAGVAGIAWLFTAGYYFYQYVLRTAPSVMMPQLSNSFGLDTVGLASLIGTFYYGYSPFSLVAGAALDRMGAKAVIPAGALLGAIGALLFRIGSAGAANLGRFLQGAGGVFALVGAVYIASNTFPSNQEHYQTTFQPVLFGVVLAIFLTVLLKETGPGHAALALPHPARA